MSLPRAIAVAAVLMCGAGQERQASADASAPGIRRVVVDYFYEAGCQDCVTVESGPIRRLEFELDGLYCLNRRELGDTSNYASLVHWTRSLGVNQDEHVFALIDERVMLAGPGAISSGLVSSVHEALALAIDASTSAPVPRATKASVRTRVAIPLIAAAAAIILLRLARQHRR